MNRREAAIVIALGGSQISKAFASNVISRADWGARPPIRVRPTLQPPPKPGEIVAAETTMPPRATAKHLTIHHTAFSFRTSVSFKDNLKAWQLSLQSSYIIQLGGGKVKRVYLGDIPYHYVINTDGQIAEGRDLSFSAYSNTHYSSPIETHITIVLDGDFNKIEPSANQMSSLLGLAEQIARTNGIALANIDYHRHVAQTDCPGTKLIAKWDGFKGELSARGIR